MVILPKDRGEIIGKGGEMTSLSWLVLAATRGTERGSFSHRKGPFGISSGGY